MTTKSGPSDLAAQRLAPVGRLADDFPVAGRRATPSGPRGRSRGPRPEHPQLSHRDSSPCSRVGMRIRTLVPAPGLDSIASVPRRSPPAPPCRVGRAGSANRIPSPPRRRSPAVVLDDDRGGILQPVEGDDDAGRPGVLQDVGHRLLDRPVDRRLDERRQPPLAEAVDPQLRGDPGPPRPLVGTRQRLRSRPPARRFSANLRAGRSCVIRFPTAFLRESPQLPGRRGTEKCGDGPPDARTTGRTSRVGILATARAEAGGSTGTSRQAPASQGRRVRPSTNVGKTEAASAGVAPARPGEMPCSSTRRAAASARSSPREIRAGTGRIAWGE